MLAATQWAAPRLYDGLEVKFVTDVKGVIIVGAVREGEVTDLVAEDGFKGLF